MSSSLNSYQYLPGAREAVFTPDQLIAGNLKLVTEQVTFASGAGALVRGTVVGRVTASGQYIKSVPTATDGSQTPVGITVDSVDATSAAAAGSIYVMGEFNSNYMTYDSTWTLDALTAACRPNNLFVKTSLSNAIV
ncbi:head decoration protein [Gluconobacter kondonii]|uniref:head decoration protein n=1 Tax=Gluconobacter kondonii TaxID=941463 RepID=UPI00197DED77|nr:head decoration protein [Gluconobacter kondonii]MBN3866447.1 head decoration protein [Gluconobacter kondonii]